MNRLLLVGSAVMSVWVLNPGIAVAQQFPMMDQVAQRVIQKYQNSSYQQLAMEKSQPPGQRGEFEQRAVAILQTTPDANAIYQYGSRSNCQQTLRMWSDSVGSGE